MTYQETVKELAQVTEQKVLRERQLNQTLGKFELKQTREQDLSEKYSDIRTVNTNLTSELQEKIQLISCLLFLS